MVLQADLVGICKEGCQTLYDADGNYLKDSNGKPKYESCNTGKSAANAMVARKNFVGTDKYKSLVAAIGLGGSTMKAKIDAPATTTCKYTATSHEY